VGFKLRLGAHTYKVQGGFYHLIGGMKPVEGQLPRFLQAYVHDVANEGLNRQMQNPNLSLAHLTTLHTILRRVNPYVNIFVCGADRFAVNPIEEVHICITASHTSGNGNVYCYNVLTINEVVMIIPGEPGEVGNYNVIVQRRYGGGLQQMNELTPSYNPLQYLLLFLAREDGWSKNLRLQNNQDGARTGSQWWLITHKECTLATNSSFYISVVAFFSNISSTLLLRHNRTFLTFGC
jgi:hypothetical protein